MKILIDTHVLLWALLSPERLSTPARDVLSDPRTTILVSFASALELILKVRTLRLALPVSAFLDRGMKGLGALWLPIGLNHILAVADLPAVHNDPFDRLLIAQAGCEQVALVTADAKMARYPIRVIW